MLSILVSWSYIQLLFWILCFLIVSRFSWIFHESNDNMQIMMMFWYFLLILYIFFLTSLYSLGPPKQCWLAVVIVDIILLFLMIPLYPFSCIFTRLVYDFHYCSVLVFHNFYFDIMSYFGVNFKFSKHRIVLYLLFITDF